MTNSDDERRCEAELEALRGEIAADDARRVLRDEHTRQQRRERLLELERQLCRHRGEEFADELDVKIGVGFEWHVVVGFTSEPVLFCPLLKPEGAKRSVAFEFVESVETSFGGLNDEVLEGHRLYGRGLDVCGFFVVRNSAWKRSVQAAMKRHPSYDEPRWERIEHFLFRDKAGELSCLATGFRSRLLEESVQELRERALGAASG